jgi:hypothetical protein
VAAVAPAARKVAPAVAAVRPAVAARVADRPRRGVSGVRPGRTRSSPRSELAELLQALALLLEAGPNQDSSVTLSARW